MKKALIISIIVLVVASIAFGISVAATGVREGQGFGISIGGNPFLGTGEAFGSNTKAGDIKTYTFKDDIRDIQLITSVAETDVKIADVDEISVRYETETGGFVFNARVEGDRLVVKEQGGYLLSIFNIGEKKSKLEVILPEKEYDDVEIITASGNTDIEQLVCKDFNSVVTSGNSKYEIFAPVISVTTTSGYVELSNCTDEKAERINLDSVSGNHTIRGFKCGEFKLNSVSGCIKAEGISGKGDADIVSGEIFIDYAEWDNDLKLNAVSGEFDITLPEDAGVKIDLDALSGEVEVELKEDDDDTDKSTFSGESNSGKLGGDNVHEVKVDLVSGEVSIHN